jgi:hypothetical protein
MIRFLVRLAFVLVWVVPALTGHAEIPDAIWGSEMLPPTAAEWIRAYLRQAESVNLPQEAFPGSRGEHFSCKGCHQVLRVRETIGLNAEVEYLPCSDDVHSSGPAGCTCKKPALHSGEYGIFHPGPYYIPNPTLAIEYPGGCEPCRSRSISAKISPDPNNRIEMTIGVWE